MIERFGLEYLQITYHHRVFQHRNYEVKHFINQSYAAGYGLFSQNRKFDLIESNSQKTLREAIEISSNDQEPSETSCLS